MLGRPPGLGRGLAPHVVGTARRGTRALAAARTRRGAPIDAPTATAPCPPAAGTRATG